jgi:hypothetical protein
MFYVTADFSKGQKQIKRRLQKYEMQFRMGRVSVEGC